MKQTKGMVKRNGAHVGVWAAFAVLIAAVCMLEIGVIRTTASADEPQTRQSEQVLTYSSVVRNANVSGSVTSQGSTCSATYYEDENCVRVTFDISGYGGVSSELDYFVTFTFNSQVYNAPQNSTIISLSNNSFFKPGNTYTVNARVEDWEYQGTGKGYSVYFSDVLTFTIPGEAVSFPEPPEKEGYTFKGWYYDAALSQPYEGAPIYEDTTLYAKFEINTYTVTFDSQGGDDVSSVTVDWNTSLAELPIPERVGYNFLGWYFEDGTPYENQPIVANITLTARWEAKTFTVQFFVDGQLYREIEVPYGTVLADVVSKKEIGMEYYNLYDESGTALGGETVIGSRLTINAVRMTKTEASATFFAKHSWLLWFWGVVTIVGVLGFVICIIYIKKTA